MQSQGRLFKAEIVKGDLEGSVEARLEEDEARGKETS